MKNIWIGVICFYLVLCVIPVQAQNSNDAGYFLTLKQKEQLIATGKIKDDQGRQYKILIVPGYQPPIRTGWKGLKKAKHNIGEFFHKRKYQSLATNSQKVLSWSYKKCLWKFTIRGAGNSWKHHFNKAASATDKRVFGWWMAYPWAVVRSAADNIGRIPTGLVITAGGTAGGLALIPSFYMIESPIKAAWNGGVVGVVVPTTGVAWNTLVTPPLALFGQKPTPARVDGFWVKQLDHREFSDEEAKLLALFGQELLKNTSLLEKEKENANQEFKEKQESLKKRLESTRTDWTAQIQKLNLQEEKIVKDIPLTGAFELLEQGQHQGNLLFKEIRNNRNKVKSALENDANLDKIASARILYLLSIYFPELLRDVATRLPSK
jgi:hypothetical protein